VGKEGGDGVVKGFDGVEGPDDHAFGELFARLDRNGEIGFAGFVRSNPLAVFKVAVETTGPCTSGGVEEVETGEVVVERAGVDGSVYATVGNGTNNGETVDEALREGSIQPAECVDDGGHEGDVDAAGDSVDRGRHEGGDADGEIAEACGDVDEGGEDLAAGDLEAGAEAHCNRDGYGNVRRERAGAEALVQREAEYGCGVQMSAEALNDRDAPLVGWEDKEASHRAVG
jgi:hypothetical protein